MPLLTKAEKATFVAALKSGEYKQGKGKMYDKKTDSYCCLGVACKVLAVKKPKGWLLPKNTLFGNVTQHGDFGLLSMPMLHDYFSLAEANDSGVQFSEIAAHIEKYMPTRD